MSNWPLAIAVDTVILARASFADRETKSRSMLGCSFSNFGESWIASCICELDTIAMVSVSSLAPIAPAPAQEAITAQLTRADAALTIARTFTAHLPRLRFGRVAKPRPRHR